MPVAGGIRFAIEVLSAALTPAIAITTTYVAFQQYQLNRRRQRLELYGRRRRILRCTLAFASAVLREATTDFEKAAAFYAKTGEVDFLFGPDIRRLIDNLYKNGLEISLLQESMYPPDGSPGLPVGEQRSAAAGRKAELLRWFYEQMPAIREGFKRYLAVS